MLEEDCYSTVFFKPLDDERSRASRFYEEPVVYAEVKIKQPASCKPFNSLGHRRVTTCLSLLCLFLLVALTAVVVSNYVYLTSYKGFQALYNQERTTKLHILAEKDLLEKEKASLVTQEQLVKSSMDFILQQSSFLVNEYCLYINNSIQCTPCPKHWIQNGSSCYYVSTGHTWKTWEKSGEYCREFGGELAIINSTEEQEFINQHTKPYYDQYHGYWIGLSNEPDRTWIWTNGVPMEDGFWVDEQPMETYKCCALSMQSNVALRSWKTANCRMSNRWICESRVLTWPNIFQTPST